MGQSVLKIVVVVLVVCGRSTNGMVSDDSIDKRGKDEDSARGLFQQQIIVNPLGESINESSCNVDTTRRLEQLQTTLSDLVELVKNLPEPSPPTEPGAPARDCSEVLEKGATTSAVYTIQPLDDGEPFDVYCDMETDGGGWTVFQRRQDGSVDFYLDWESYRQGFGDLDGEFWLGNDNLHRLTAQGDCELRVDIADSEGNSAYSVYDTFRVADGSDKYRVTVGGYSGTAGDSLAYHNNMRFSTKDNDNDVSGSNCATAWDGAWWYMSCHYSNLNGDYFGIPSHGVTWYHWKGQHHSLKSSAMKIRMK